MKLPFPVLCVAVACCSSACGGRQAFAPVVPAANTASNAAAPAGAPATYGALARVPTPIKHVIIIFQENRTPDYLFQGVPDADIAKTAIDSKGETVPLRPISLAAGYDLDHSHAAFVQDYDLGKMDGFDRGLSGRHHLRPFGYAPMSEVKPYYEMATQYAFADHMFQSNQGPSFPAHMYIIAGRATDEVLLPNIVEDNPKHKGHKGVQQGGCDSSPGTTVPTINAETGKHGPSPFPCFDPAVLSDFLDAKKLTWRYYQTHRGAGLWHGYDAIKHVRYGKDYENVVSPSESVLTDIAHHRLANVTWVTPADAWSDHAGKRSTTQGPAWVAAIVNAIGKSPYWKDSAIFITWDDWGGWYDHEPAPIQNYYELGFRVPLVVVSP
ncbi:MAG: hypothetical protein JO030_01610, partial [Candidatus Eremiobacteraeota bacterium]|nr:hypothetical protein [Candidatus Eremiobacteraeota bacterium]